MTLEIVLVVAGALFSIGLFGVLARRNIIAVIMSLELMFNGVLVAAIGFFALHRACRADRSRRWDYRERSPISSHRPHVRSVRNIDRGCGNRASTRFGVRFLSSKAIG